MRLSEPGQAVLERRSRLSCAEERFGEDEAFVELRLQKPVFKHIVFGSRMADFPEGDRPRNFQEPGLQIGGKGESLCFFVL